MADLVRSPQADIFDELIWSRLSSFWTKDYDPTDREALNAVYDAATQVLDAEYTRLYEINTGKSLVTAPKHTQRRWLRLDLNRNAELEAFLRFLRTDAQSGSTATVTKASDAIECVTPAANHARHWHITFPYVVPNGDVLARSTIELFFPTELSLVTIYRMEQDLITGERRGVRLRPNTDYIVLPTSSAIRITNANVGDVYECNVGFDFSGSVYDGLVPNVAYTSGIDRLGSNLIPIPGSISQQALPVHVLVVRNVVDTGTGGLADTNNSAFSTTSVFYPWTGTSAGPQYGTVTGQLILPTTIGPEDAVYVFGLEAGTWDLVHSHKTASTLLNSAAVPGFGGTPQAGSTSTIEFSTLVRPGLFGSLGYLGQTLEVLINGKLLPRSDYRFGFDNRLYLRTAVSWGLNEAVRVEVRFSDEFREMQAEAGVQHIHYICSVDIASPPQQFSTFDDGGDFDVGDEVFDDTFAINVLHVADAIAEPSTMEVFLAGVYLTREVDYTAVVDPDTKKIRLSFVQPITGKSVVVTYRRESRTYVYGDYGTVSGLAETISGLVTDVQGLIQSFGAQYQFNAQNAGRLVEAAAIAANGGDPFLTLFFDEYEEYADLPIDAPNQPLSSFDARTVESYNTKLAAIPFLVDHVLHPTVRLQEGKEYTIVDGKVQSSRDLTAPRGADDTQPGVWWCPIVLFDEQILAKNFGALVGDPRPSSSKYQRELLANFLTRFGGPIVQNVEWNLAVMLGSPMFQHDATVTAVNEVPIGYHVAIGNGTTQQTVRLPSSATPPSIGDEVVPSQSLVQPPIFIGTMVDLLRADGGLIELQMALPAARVGDVMTFDVFRGTDAIPFTARIKSIKLDNDLIIPRTTLVLDRVPRYQPTTASKMTILRPGGPPYAAIAGVVTSVTPIIQFEVRTTQERITLPIGSRPEQRAGQKVVRGEPVLPSYAQLYDHQRRPNWQWLTPEQTRGGWDFRARGRGDNVPFGLIEDNRLATVSPPTGANGYSPVLLAPASPIPPRGATITLTDGQTGDELVFTVVGQQAGQPLVTPAVTTTRSGACVVSRAADGTAPYFESPAPALPVETALAFPQPVRARVLQVLSTTNFPDAGRISIRLPNGGAVEFTYKGKAAGFLLDCEWPNDFPALTDNTGAVATMLPADSRLRLISAFSRRRVNPAFLALVSERVKGSNVSTASPQTVDALYDLLKANATVFESRVTARPAAVRDAIKDLTPAGSSVVSVTKYVIADVYVSGVDER